MAELNYCLSDDTFSPFRSSHIQIKSVSEDWERKQYYALRKQVFGEEQKLFSSNERDSADFHAIAIIALCNNCAVADNVVGAVRIFQDKDSVQREYEESPETTTWFGGRLCVAQPYRRFHSLGMSLINAAVCRAKALGCERFLANIQPQNEAYFARLHWSRIGEISIQGQPHVRMQVDLDRYPLPQVSL